MVCRGSRSCVFGPVLPRTATTLYLELPSRRMADIERNGRSYGCKGLKSAGCTIPARDSAMGRNAYVAGCPLLRRGPRQRWGRSRASVGRLSRKWPCESPFRRPPADAAADTCRLCPPRSRKEMGPGRTFCRNAGDPGEPRFCASWRGHSASGCPCSRDESDHSRLLRFPGLVGLDGRPADLIARHRRVRRSSGSGGVGHGSVPSIATPTAHLRHTRFLASGPGEHPAPFTEQPERILFGVRDEDWGEVRVKRTQFDPVSGSTRGKTGTTGRWRGFEPR